MNFLDRDHATFKLTITRRLLLGLKQAFLETVTDLVYADSPEADEFARQVLAFIGEGLSDTERVLELRKGASFIRLCAVDEDNWLLEATRDLLGILTTAVSHAQESLLDFEVPIRIKLKMAELVDLGHMLDEYASS